MELCAIKEGLLLAVRLNLRSVVVLLSDCLEAINLLMEEEDFRNELGVWRGDILEIRKQFEAMSFTYINRKMNSWTDALAKFALSGDVSLFWDGIFPPWLIGGNWGF